MKKITVNNKRIGSGIKYIGWSGRGWADGGPIGAGPIHCYAPSWESYGQEIGINMVRMGFSIRHFLSNNPKNQRLASDQIKKGLENTGVSWAKSEHTSYSYAIQRCHDLGWKILICINPSYNSPWNPSLISPSSSFLEIWKDFCFSLAQSIEDNWPGMAEYFEITNEPDIGYFDGESFLPNYRGPSGGITPSQYCLLLQNAYQGARDAIPDAKIIGPGLASWNRDWLEEVRIRNSLFLDGFSYHNVGGNLKDEDTLKEARQLLSQHAPHAADFIINSEWAWWPNHDIDSQATALRIAQILYFQTKGNAGGSLYLGPAQPKEFKKGLGLLQFDSDNPNFVVKTKTFFAFRLMARGFLGGKQLGLIHPFKKLKILALVSDRKELVITVINPAKKRFKNIAIDIDEAFHPLKEPFLKIHKIDHNHSDSCEKSDHEILKKFSIEPESINQFVIPISH